MVLIGASVASAGLGIAGTVMQARGQVQQGIAARDVAQMEAEQYDAQADMARSAALQDEAQRRSELQRVLAAQAAIRAARGLDLQSASGTALRKATIREAEGDIVTARANYLARTRNFGLGSKAARRRGDAALTGATYGAMGTALGGIGKAVTRIPDALML